jgi:hypothetical protein
MHRQAISRETGMKDHQFTLILTGDPNEEEAERIYGIINDGTISTIAGVPQIHFHRQAPLQRANNPKARWKRAPQDARTARRNNTVRLYSPSVERRRRMWW